MPEDEIEPAAPRSQDENLVERPVKGIYYYAVAHGRTTGVFRDWRYVSFRFVPSRFDPIPVQTQ